MKKNSLIAGALLMGISAFAQVEPGNGNGGGPVVVKPTNSTCQPANAWTEPSGTINTLQTPTNDRISLCDKYKYVGINTNNPIYPLDVNGLINARQGVRFADGTVQTTAIGNTTGLALNSVSASNYLKVGANSLYITAPASNVPGVPSGSEHEIFVTDNDLFIQSNSSYNYNTIINGKVGTAAVNTGNVGIGTDQNPSAKLEVEIPNGTSNIEDGIWITKGGGALKMVNASSNANMFIPNIIGTNNASYSSAGLYFASEVPANSSGTNYWGFNFNVRQNGGDLQSGYIFNVKNNNTSKFRIDYNGFARGLGFGAGRIVMQSESSPVNNWNRGTLASNLVWNENASRYDLVYNNQFSDFAAIRFENAGRISFYNAPNNNSGGNGYISETALQTHRSMTIASDGKVGIGTLNFGVTENANRLLFVGGGIICNELEVQNTWADYVFDEEYELKSLNEVEQYISENKHLPDVPSAEEIENGTLNVGEMMKIQMQKIEELTLYVIQLKKENEELKNLIEK